MGVHALIPYLKRMHGDLITTEAHGAPLEAHTLLVDFMGALYALMTRRSAGSGGGADAATEATLAADAGAAPADAWDEEIGAPAVSGGAPVCADGAAGAPPLLTGSAAFAIVSRTVLRWLRTPRRDPETGAELPRRAIIITDKPAWVPPAKQNEQAARREALERQAERARAAGTYQSFVDDGDALRFDDGGIVAPLSTGSPLSVPFDGFSVISQRPARAALVQYLRARFAAEPLPPRAELVIDFDADPEAPLLTNATPHALLPTAATTTATAAAASGGGGVGGDDGTVFAACTVSPVVVGHATCGARGSGGTGVVGSGAAANGTGGLWRPSKRTGEAEVLAVQYALQAACAGPPGGTVCIYSADGDTMAVACRAFWDAPNGARLLWWQRADVVVDLTALYARLHTWPNPTGGPALRITPEHVLLALIAMGTDYARKRDLFNWIRDEDLWDAVCTYQFPAPSAPTAEDGDDATAAGGGGGGGGGGRGRGRRGRGRGATAAAAPAPQQKRHRTNPARPAAAATGAAAARDEVTSAAETDADCKCTAGAGGGGGGEDADDEFVPAPTELADAVADANEGAGAAADMHLDDMGVDTRGGAGAAPVLDAPVPAPRAATQATRDWSAVERLVRHVYTHVARGFKPANVASGRAAERVFSLLDAYRAGGGQGAYTRVLPRTGVEALYQCFKQRRIALPRTGGSAARAGGGGSGGGGGAPAAAAAMATDEGGDDGPTGDTVAGVRVRAAKPTLDLRDGCARMAENLAYWFAVPLNEQRIDSA